MAIKGAVSLIKRIDIAAIFNEAKDQCDAASAIVRAETGKCGEK